MGNCWLHQLALIQLSMQSLPEQVPQHLVHLAHLHVKLQEVVYSLRSGLPQGTGRPRSHDPSTSGIAPYIRPRWIKMRWAGARIAGAIS